MIAVKHVIIQCVVRSARAPTFTLRLYSAHSHLMPLHARMAKRKPGADVLVKHGHPSDSITFQYVYALTEQGQRVRESANIDRSACASLDFCALPLRSVFVRDAWPFRRRRSVTRRCSADFGRCHVRSGVFCACRRSKQAAEREIVHDCDRSRRV